MNTWRLKTHHIDPDAALHWSREHNRIAVGWGKVGNLKVHNFDSREKISRAIRDIYPQLKGNNPHYGGRSLWNLWCEIQHGDLIVIRPAKASRCVVRVLGDYIFDDTNRILNDDYFHQRHVEFTNLDPKRVWCEAGGALANGEGICQTLLRVDHR